MADTTHYRISNETSHDKLQEATNEIVVWSKNNDMMINATKIIANIEVDGTSWGHVLPLKKVRLFWVSYCHVT